MKAKKMISSSLRMALILVLICGLLYPALVTGIGQGVFPYQANGELAKLDNTTVGSYLIGQSTNNSEYLFNVRNNSASGVDPDITVASALIQAQVIHNATNISLSYLDGLIHNNTRHTLFFFGTAYVNALKLDIQIIDEFHSKIALYSKIYNNTGKTTG